MQTMKKIDMQGIMYIEPLAGSSAWHWGMDYTSRDLYEAEELFKRNHPVSQNKLLFVHYPDSRVIQPVVAQKGQYLGRPIYDHGAIILLMVDFAAAKIFILRYDEVAEKTTTLAEILLTDVPDCYNLMLISAPLTLIRQGSEADFQILWPQKQSFTVARNESLLFRDGEKLYFSAWHEEPDYREEIIVRQIADGTIIERIPGSLAIMPDGQKWILS